MINWISQYTWSIRQPIFLAPFIAFFCLTASYFTPLDKFLCFVLLMTLSVCQGMFFDVVDAIRRGWYDSME